jgi:competence protein ComEC
VAPGDAIGFDARLQAPPEDAFGAYLGRLGVTATAEVRSLTIVRPSDDPVESIRRDADAALAAILPEPEAGLASGVMLGLRDRVDRDLAADLTTAGLSHIVAISGWNIAVVAGLIAAVLYRWPRRRRALAMIAAIAIYTVLAGASPSVVRAALMAGVVLSARELGRPGRAAAALGLAALAILIAEPSTVLDAGFLLSVAATAGLLAWAAPLTRHLAARSPTWTPAWIVEALGVSLAAQAATLPVVLVAFGRLSLVAPAANLAAAGLVLPAMVVGAVALPVGWLVDAGLPDAIGAPVALAARGTFGLLIAIGRVAARVPFASLELPPAVAVLLAAGAVVAVGIAAVRRSRLRSSTAPEPAAPEVGSSDRASPDLASRDAPPAITDPLYGFAARGDKGRPVPDPARDGSSAAARLWLAALAVVIVGSGLAASSRPGGRLRVTVLDVGQGDAILVEGDAGTRMLVDGGPDPDRLLVVLDERLPAWDRRIDLVVLTHPHEDHVAGLAILLERYRVRTVAEVGMHGPGPGYAAFHATLERLGIDRGRLATGDRLRVDGTTIEVRWPPRGSVPFEPPDTGTGINNVSAVLDLHYGVRRLLLMGDVEEAIDPQLIAAGIADGRRLDLLKVAHHGSRTASTEAFLGALRPRVAVISAGTGNPYGHPTRQTLDRFAAIGARVFRTDTDGTVAIETDGQDLRVAAGGGRESAGSGPGPTGRRVWQGAGQPYLGARLSAALASTLVDPPPTADPAARYRCATPRIGPWIPDRAGTRGIARARRTARWPWEAGRGRPRSDERGHDQRGLLLGRGRLGHGARRARYGARARGRRPNGRRARRWRHGIGDLARRCRSRDERWGRLGRSPPRPDRRAPGHGAALRRRHAGHAPPADAAAAREGESGAARRAHQ